MRKLNLFPSSQSSRLFGQLTRKFAPLAISKALLVFVFFSLTKVSAFAHFSRLLSDQTAGDSCACQNGGALQASLLANGTFSAGYTGFSSGLSPNILCSAGSYWVGNNFQIHCSGWPSVFDHTTGNAGGSFLIIDGDPWAAANIWSQPVNIVPGMTY